MYQSAATFKARSATLGLTDKANVDQGEMWPTSYGIKTLKAGDDANIAKLITEAVT